MNGSKSYRKFISSAVSVALVSSIPAPFVANYVSAQQPNFSDVKQTDYFFDAVQSLALRNVIQGYNDGTFRPYENVTRAQAAKMLALALGLDMKNVEDPGFKDVAKSDWFYGAVAALVKAGVLKGYNDGTFRPYQTMTRAQMAKVVSLGFKLQESKHSELPFVDVKSSDWFAGFVKSLYENGITTGKTKNEFVPNESVKRGQLAVFIYRAENLKTEIKTAKVKKITKEFVVLDGEVYTFGEKIANILNGNNAEVLENANLTVEVKGKQITKIKSLEIVNSGVSGNLVLDGQQGIIDGDVKVNGDHVTLKNLFIDGNLHVGKDVQNHFSANYVTVTGKVTVSDHVTLGLLLYKKSFEYQSLASKAKATQALSTTISFENSVLNRVEWKKPNAVLDLKGTTSVKEVAIESDAVVNASSSSVEIRQVLINNGSGNVQLNARCSEVVVQSADQLTLGGNGQIANLKIKLSANITLSTSGKIDQLSVEDAKAQITLQSNVKIGNVVTAEGMNVSMLL